MLHPGSVGGRALLCVEHCRYGARDLSLVEKAESRIDMQQSWQSSQNPDTHLISGDHEEVLLKREPKLKKELRRA